MLLSNFEYFLTIVELKNITKASQKLYLSQPSLSQYLIKLENELGVRLFERKNNQMKLTYAGEKYLEYVNKFIEMDSQMKEEFEKIKASGHGDLSIGITLWKGAFMLHGLLPMFKKIHPNVELNIQEAGSPTLASLVASNKLEVCILNEYKRRKELHYDVLLEERLLLVCKKDNVLIQGLETSLETPAPLDIEMLANETFILPMPDQALSDIINDFFNKREFKPKKTMMSKNIDTILDLAASGMGYAFVPEMVINFCRNKNDLAFFTTDDPPMSWSVSVAHKKDRPLSDAAKDFIEITKKYYTKIAE